MRKDNKLLFLSAITTLLLTGCGSNTTTQSDSGSASFNSTNYVEVAQEIYANPEKLTKALPPQAETDPHTMYLSKIVKPRDREVSGIEVTENGQTLTISVDNTRKYATVTLNQGSANQEVQVVNFKDFTAPQQ